MPFDAQGMNPELIQSILRGGSVGVPGGGGMPPGGMPPGGGMPGGMPPGGVLAPAPAQQQRPDFFSNPMTMMGASILAANGGRAGAPIGIGGRLGNAMQSAIPQIQAQRQAVLEQQQAEQQQQYRKQLMDLRQGEAKTQREELENQKRIREETQKRATTMANEYRSRFESDGTIDPIEQRVLGLLKTAELTGNPAIMDQAASLLIPKDPENFMETKNVPGVGMVAYDKRDPGGTARVIQQEPGKAAKPTQSEQEAAGFLGMMDNAEQLINDVMFTQDESGNPVRREDFDPTSRAQDIYSKTGYLGNVLMSEDQQQYRNAARAWVAAKLRKESGAQISDEEFAKDFQTFFPQPGDGPQVIEQKNRLRQNAMEAVRVGAGSLGGNGDDGWGIE
jgi:hypothetical protein